MAIMLLRSFKVINFGTNRKPIYDFLLVININLPGTSYLAPFLSYVWLYVKFSLATGGRFTLMLSMGVIPCEYRHKLYIVKN